MSKIDVSQWKKFKIMQLFNVELTDGDNQPKKMIEGNIPLISATADNNGLIGYYTSDTRIFPRNTITVDMFGHAFVQSKKYQTVSHGRVNVFLPKKTNLSFNSLFFIASVINKVTKQHDYGYKTMLTRSKSLKLIIKLPVDSNGDPDWHYMDEYIAKLATQAHTNISLLRQQQKKAPTVNIDRWKEFKIDNLFEKITTKKLPYKATQLPHHATEDNLIPLVTAGVEHQGRSVYAPKTKDITVLSNCLTISANGANSGATFYQDKPFSILQDAYAIQVKLSINENVSKYEYCFLASVIGKRLQQNDWTNKATWNVVKAKEIRLPVTESDEPDWQYMNNYISSIQQVQKKRVARLTSIVK